MVVIVMGHGFSTMIKRWNDFNTPHKKKRWTLGDGVFPNLIEHGISKFMFMDMFFLSTINQLNEKRHFRSINMNQAGRKNIPSMWVKLIQTKFTTSKMRFI